MLFFSFFLACVCTLFVVSAQQYVGDTISALLPELPRMEVAFFRIKAPTSQAHDTLINYQSLNSAGDRVQNVGVERALIVIHGLLRDPWNYCNDVRESWQAWCRRLTSSQTLNALEKATAQDSNINRDTVVILCPYFTNGDDKGFGYPWNSSADPGHGSYTSALVWSGSQWSAGADNHYPHSSRHTSSFYVMDMIIRYFDNTSRFPGLKQIVLVGHSLGGQTLSTLR